MPPTLITINAVTNQNGIKIRPQASLNTSVAVSKVQKKQAKKRSAQRQKEARHLKAYKKLQRKKRAEEQKLQGHTLSNADKLVRWTLERQLISNAMSAATQLLLLAHTPVSRKVFQYFFCHYIWGKPYLRADYGLECFSTKWWAFIPVVLVVLGAFTIALPAVISFYLFIHRKELYSTSVYQTVGWLYDPFVRGSEFWQVHDVLLKMVLTGMLIYVPNLARASVAIILCVVAILNLNFFQPHKNRVLFWLTQLSFLVTVAKYVTTLMIGAAKNMTADGHFAIGVMLITLDVFFFVSSAVSIVLAVYLLRKKVNQIREEEVKQEERLVKVVTRQQKRRQSLSQARNKMDINDLETTRARRNSRMVVPVDKGGQGSEGGGGDDAGPSSSSSSSSNNNVHKSDSEEAVTEEEVIDLPLFPDEAGDSSLPLYPLFPPTQDSAHDVDGESYYFGSTQPANPSQTFETPARRNSTIHKVESLVQHAEKHALRFNRVQSQRQKKQKRHTQMRLKARSRVKQTNALARVPMFSDCDRTTIDRIVDSMKYERFPPGTVLCQQGDQADRFYVIVTGQCGVTVWRDDILGPKAKKERSRGGGGSSKDNSKGNKKEDTVPSATSPKKKALPGLGFSNFNSAERRDSLTKQLLQLHGKVPQAVVPRATIRVGTLEALEYFGESALLGKAGVGKTRAATVTTEGDANVQVLSISNEDFLSLVDQGFLNGTEFLRTLQAENKKRIARTSSANFASSRRHNDGTFKMVKCDICDKWRHVEEIFDGKFTCRMIGERCATGVLL